MGNAITILYSESCIKFASFSLMQSFILSLIFTGPMKPEISGTVQLQNSFSRLEFPTVQLTGYYENSPAKKNL